jgi:putative copper resistance protein D
VDVAATREPGRVPEAPAGAVRRLLVGAPGVVGAAGVVAVLVAAAFSGAAAALVLGDPGAGVRWGLPVASTLVDVASATTLGALLLAAFVVPLRRGSPSARGSSSGGRALGTRDAWGGATTLAAGAAGAWTVLAVVELVLTYASVAGTAPGEAGFGDQLGLFVTQVDLGRTLTSVVVLVAVATVLAMLVATPTGVAWTALVVLVALWQVASTGHAAGAANHELATESLLLHLVGAVIWVGALAGLAVLVVRLGADVTPAVARYSHVAGWCLAIVGASGLANAWVRVGDAAGLATRYGVLVVAKAALLVALGLLGLAHRRATIPKLRAGASWPFWRLVLVELVVMGAVSGVAVALSATAPPVSEALPADPTPAYLLTGHPLPPEPTFASWFTQWRIDPLTLTAAVAGVVVYVRWARRLRGRGDAWPWARLACWLTAMAVFAWTTSGGPNVYGHVLFSGHMLQHMVLAMVVPVLVALSAPVTLALRALPVRGAALRGDRSRGPREWLLVLVHSRVATFFANPLVAAANFAFSMVVFYYTEVFGWSLRTTEGHLFMVVHFSLAGYLFANALVGVDPGPRRPGYPQRLLLLFATMAFHAFFGVALVGGDVLLVADWFGWMGRPWGPSAIADQRIGGSIAWGIGELPTLALAIGVAVAWSRDDERAARRRDRRVDRSGDTELEEYNAMLARLAARDAGDPSSSSPPPSSPPPPPHPRV